MQTKILREGKTWFFKGKIIVTDREERNAADSVMPLCHENTYLAEKLCAKKGSKVLDLCTGSGILAIFAADKAWEVYATDINPRALEFARLNAELNDVGHKIHFLQGNLFVPVKDMKFNLITANPPFEPLPRNKGYFIHSAGGRKGDEILTKILSGIESRLAPGGDFQIITWLAEGRLKLLEKINRECYNEVKIETLQVFSAEQVREYLHKRLGAAPGFHEPVHYLFIQGFGFRRCRKPYDKGINTQKEKVCK